MQARREGAELDDDEPPKKTAYMRATKSNGQELFSIVGVTCALGRQLLHEYEHY